MDFIRPARISSLQFCITALYDRFAFLDMLDAITPSIPASMQACRISLVIPRIDLFCCFKKGLLKDIDITTICRYNQIPESLLLSMMEEF